MSNAAQNLAPVAPAPVAVPFILIERNPDLCRSASPTIGAIAGALAQAQGEIEQPEKNRSVTVQTKTGGKYTFEYADLAAIQNVIRGPLSKNQICYMHSIEADEKGPCLRTMLIHSSGEWFASRYPLPNTSDPKDLGGAITYGKRYSLSAMLGVVADDDNDADSDHLTEQPRARQPQAQAPRGPVVAPAAAPSPLAPVGSQPAPVTREQCMALYAQAKGLGWDEEGIKAFIKETTGATSSRELTQEQYAQVRRDLQQTQPRKMAAPVAPKPLTQAAPSSAPVNRSVDSKQPDPAKSEEPLPSPGDIARRAGERMAAERNAKVRPRQPEPELHDEGFANFRG